MCVCVCVLECGKCSLSANAGFLSYLLFRAQDFCSVAFVRIKPFLTALSTTYALCIIRCIICTISYDAYDAYDNAYVHMVHTHTCDIAYTQDTLHINTHTHTHTPRMYTRERERDRQTDRQERDRQTERQREREAINYPRPVSDWLWGKSVQNHVARAKVGSPLPPPSFWTGLPVQV